MPAIPAARLAIFSCISQCSYYNDVWEFDTDELRWQELNTKNTGPAPRGGCQLALHANVLFCFGGHSVLRDAAGEHDRVHDDVWALDLKLLEVRVLRRFYPRQGVGRISGDNRDKTKEARRSVHGRSPKNAASHVSPALLDPVSQRKT